MRGEQYKSYANKEYTLLDAKFIKDGCGLLIGEFRRDWDREADATRAPGTVCRGKDREIKFLVACMNGLHWNHGFPGGTGPTAEISRNVLLGGSLKYESHLKPVENAT